MRKKIFAFKISESSYDMLEFASEQIGISKSELARRMIDHCLCEKELWNVVPPISGRISLDISLREPME